MSELIFDTIRSSLFTAVVSDVLDQMGYRKQFLPADIRPLRDDMQIIGRAMPVLEADVYDETCDTACGHLARNLSVS